MPLGPKAANPVGHMFYNGLYKENHKKSCCPKPLGLEPRYYVCSNWHLVNLYQVCLNYASRDQKWPRHGAHMYYLHKEKFRFYILISM